MREYPHVFEFPFKYDEDLPCAMRGCWGKDFFHNDHPIVIELGCGRGEYTVGLAQRYPDKNFIGFDIKGARMWTGATQALNDQMANVAFVRTHIELIERFFAPGEVAEIWITFADPQMKKVNKRLTCTLFMQRYLNILQPEGLVHLKSDSNFLFTYTEEMARANQLPIVASTRNLYEDEDFAPAATIEALRGIRTYYESQWIARGLDIKYLCFQPQPRHQWQEPDIEIELDSYRSFGRDKRSSLNLHS